MANEFKIKKGLIVTGADGGTVVDIQGSQGQLFSVTDDLSGSIFAVSDISGVPILDVNSSGLSTFDGDINLPDNKKILLGTGNDLEIYHDESHSYINDTGTGALKILASQFEINNAANTENIATFTQNGAVSLFYNNAQKLATTNTGVTVTGSLTTTATGGGTGILMHTNSGISISSNLMQFWTGQSSGYKFYANSTGDETNELLALDASGNATFGGNVIVTGNAVNSDVIITSAELALLQLEDIGLNKTYNIELGRSSTAGDLTFRSTSGEKVRFTEAGNVGIGTDSPDYKLDVSSTSAVGARISTSGFTNLDLVSNRTSGNLGGLRFKQDIDAAQTGEFLGLHGGGFDWKVGNGNAAPSIKMRLDSGGKLGIGTTLPLYPLDVSGVAQASGFKSKTGTYTNNTETNKWQKVVSFGYSTFSFDSFKLLANIGGDTSNLNTNAEIHINYKFQNNNGRLYANIVNYGDTPLLAENFEIYRDGAAATITVFQKITRNYSTPSWTLINSPVNNPYTWYGTVVGANLNTETNDPWTAKTIINSVTTTMTDGNVGIGTTSPDFKLQISTPGIISGSAYSWPFDLSRVGSSTRGFSIGVGVAGGNIALGNHNGDMSLGQTYGVDSNGLPVFYETMRISHDGTPSGGNVGIGTTAPGAKLEVAEGYILASGSGTSHGFQLSRDSSDTYQIRHLDGGLTIYNSTDSRKEMTFRGDGNVGIGTTSPGALLDVSNRVFIDTYSSEASGNNPVVSGFLRIRAGAKTGWGADDQLGKLEFYGADTSAVGARTAASIIAVCETGNGTSTTTFSSGLAFYTSPYNAAQEERIRITAVGDVGIGTSTPNAKLDIQGTQGQLFSVTDDLSGDIFSVADISGVPIMNVNSDGTSYFDGKVGIGTTSPNTPLEVTGGISTTSSDFVIASTGERLLLQTAPSPYSYSYIQATSAGGTLISEVLALQPNGGYVGIGTTSAQSKLDIVGTTNTSNSSLLRVRTSNNPNAPEKVVGFYVNTNTERGFISVNQYSTTYSTSSDYRLKENIVPISNSIERLKELKPCRFNFIQGDPNYVVDGFIAHEAAEVIPEAVTGEKDAVDEDNNPLYQGIDQSKVVPLLTAALKEAISKIEQLETRIQALENN